LDNTFALTGTAGDVLVDVRTGKNGRHLLVGLLRQSVFGRLAGYEDVNDASGCAAIRPCAEWSAAGRSKAQLHGPANQSGDLE